MRENYAEVIALIQKSLEPLLSKLDGKVDRLADKVDELARNRVTREDMDKLRSEMHTTFVAKDPYEVRHANLISRDTYMEGEIKRIDNDIQVEVQRLRELLERCMQQTEKRFKDQEKESVSGRERLWTRIGIVFSIIVGISGIATFIAQHFQFK